MPELPEVETVIRGLAPRLLGHSIVESQVFRADLRWPFPPRLSDILPGSRILKISRRGKYILLGLTDDQTLLIHLGMSGRLRLNTGTESKRTTHEHFRITLDNQLRVSFIDPRRFGVIDLVAKLDIRTHRLLSHLGPEPLTSDFTWTALQQSLARRHCAIKIALLDQAVVAGLGNIYVCEALFRAQISPFRQANSITPAEGQPLVRAIKATLREAIKAGGSSLRDYLQPSGELGYFQHEWRVYGRENQPCQRCTSSDYTGQPPCPLILRETQGGRSTFYCSRSQV